MGKGYLNRKRINKTEIKILYIKAVIVLDNFI